MKIFVFQTSAAKDYYSNIKFVNRASKIENVNFKNSYFRKSTINYR